MLHCLIVALPLTTYYSHNLRLASDSLWLTEPSRRVIKSIIIFIDYQTQQVVHLNFAWIAQERIIYKENTNTMKTKNQIKINGTDIIVGPNEQYYLSYPIDVTLCEFLVRNVLTYNYSSDKTSTPFSCFIGDHTVLNSLNKALHDVPSGALGNFCYLSETSTQPLKEFI